MKKTIIIIGIIVVIATIGTIAAFSVLNTRTANSEAVRIYLPEGTTRDAMIDTLAHNLPPSAKSIDPIKVIRFINHAAGGRLFPTVRPGSYVVEPHMQTLALVRKLRNGQQDPIRLTIGKFRTPQQLNEYLNSKLMHDDFHVTLDSFHLVLPDTYEFYWTVTPEQFMQRMRKEYDVFWSARKCKEVQGSAGTIQEAGTIVLHSSALHSTTCTPQEIIILASIIEEETNDKGEKPLIASVYINRLKRGMSLQADPTVKYAVGDFTLRRILNKHLAVESPFNTYLHAGLPPAPICLPSKATIDAVLNAPETNYLYFCASDKMDGTHRFATTLAEHNRNAAAFHRALNSRGVR